jgi:hypothetical protein
MDWALAIDRNRDALRRIVLALFALAGIGRGGVVAMLPAHVYSAVMLVLRPAESAVRRLVVIAARGLVVPPRAARAAPVGLVVRAAEARMPAFQLIDPLKDFGADAFSNDGWPPLRMSFPGSFDPDLGAHPVSSAPVSAQHLCRRLNALRRALDDLPRQARRLARWRARRDIALKRKGPFRPFRVSPFRPGPPPGYRKRKLHEVDEVLRECHGLALDLLNTS